MHRRTRRLDASALVLAVAALGIVAVLGVAFARLASLESDVAQLEVDRTRARFLAAAGLERAIAEIQKEADQAWDGPSSTWFYRGHPGSPTGHGIPLAEATSPSLAAGTTPSGRPYSGALSSTHEALGDTYVLRVSDLASRVDVNLPRDPRRPDADQPLVRMLANLSQALDPDQPPLSPAEAEMVLAHRDTLPGRRYEEVRDLLAIPGRPVTEDEFDRLADFLTTRAWSDSMVVAPMDPTLLPAVGSPIYQRTPTGVPARLARQPVNANTAPVEVLTAVFAEVSAFHVVEGGDVVPGNDPLWPAVGRSARTTPVSLGQADALARALALRRDTAPLRAWSDFAAFLDDQVAAGIVDRLQAWAILANADPNTDSHRANPGAPIHRPVDKFDLVASTTELCFSSMGRFEIESIGRLTDAGGLIRAQATVRATVAIYSVVRETSQSQFVRGTISSHAAAEPVWFQPASSVLVEEDLWIGGQAYVEGMVHGSVHSNRDLDLSGQATIDGDATASGRVHASPSSVVGGLSEGRAAPQPIPVLRPSDYRDLAAHVFGADGLVRDGGGLAVATGSFGGWNFQAVTGTWKWSGATQLEGLLYLQGNVEIHAGTSGTWAVTIVATGSISIAGTPQLAPAAGQTIGLLAGSDIQILGNAQAQLGGVLYASDQIEIGGDVLVEGIVVAKGLGSSSHLVRSDRIHGSVHLRNTGGLDPILIGFKHRGIANLAIHPEPSVTVDVGGQPTFLPAFADADGWISLGTIDTPEAILGPVPVHDRLLARFGTGFEADLAGGSPVHVPDAGGPRIGPILGADVPGQLLPDGAYGELDASLAYEAPGNVGALSGTIAFWFKPSWDAAAGPDASRRSHHLLSLSRTEAAGTQSFQLAQVGKWTQPWWNRTGFHFERSALENAGAQRLIYSPWMPPAHRWTHVALSWDFLSTTESGAIALTIDGVEIPGAIHDSLGDYELTELELAHAGITPGNLLRLGERLGFDYVLPATGADATFDELVSIPEATTAAWAAAIHLTGRYHNGGSAVYDSAELPIPAGSRLLWAAWTLRRDAADPGPPVSLRVLDGDRVALDTTDPAGASIDSEACGAVRYRLVFQSAPVDLPLYVSPVVDDVTLAFRHAPRFLAWEEH